MQHIIVLGAGLAGAVCALGLQRQGYHVTVIGSSRSFAVEAYQSVMHSFKTDQVWNCVGDCESACSRHVICNGTSSAQNKEFLLDRPLFDAALIAQLKRENIPVIEENESKESKRDSGIVVQLKTGRQVVGDFLVEARGRQAPASGKGLRGPETISLLNRWKGKEAQAQTTVTSLLDGWSWMAQLPDGRCYWQLTLDVNAAQLPGKKELIEYCMHRRAHCTVAQHFFRDQDMPKLEQIDLHARSSTSTLSQEVLGKLDSYR